MSSSECDVEIVQRYNLFKESLAAASDTIYRTTSERLPKDVTRRPVFVTRSASPFSSGQSQRRYFMSFYRSFIASKVRETVEWVDMVIQCECELRRHLRCCEQEERAALCRRIAEVTGMPYDTTLLVTNVGQLVSVEKVARNLLITEYISMLMEACEAQEIMIRREYELQLEPDERHRITRSENVSWLQSRRCQFERQNAHATGHDSVDANTAIQYFEWRQQQLYQVFLFEQSERQERMWLERLERLHAGVIADMYNESYRGTYYLQLRYERSKLSLTPALSVALTAEEASTRSSVLFAQLDQFRAIQAQEICDYLACRRRILRNEHS